ncbi:unnamed protein product [Mytilus coruscus]|uniref:C2H2-type domain-containing protein n=1 Tax=Mytilus coruscus TaxID=42192 RepID=A0A6J8EEZ6_MYTCO|nr:unnamed protein product [Mytilus coruscus]
MKSKTRRIRKLEWKTLFVLTVNPLKCKDGESCSCLYKAISGIQVTDIEKDLASEILHSTSPLKQAVEGIVDLRNTYFAHVKENSLSDMQFKDALNRCENYMKTIAIACQSNIATVTEIIENVKEMSLDGRICDQLNTILLSQIVDKTDINKNFKRHDRNLHIIDEKNNRFLEVGQEIKEGNKQILENQEKLRQQNEQILAMLSREKWYEKLFNKVTCLFTSSLSVLDSGDESELYRFTCKKCRIDFTILEEFLKHKEKVHDKKPRQRVRTTITGADKVWESVVMDFSGRNTRSFDVENFEIENTRSGSLIFVAKISSAVVASKDKILEVIQAFLINLFQQCSLPNMSLKNIDIKVEVYESFSDEEDDNECDTYYCGRCGLEYKSLGSFLLHTESQGHKQNRKHPKETKSYTKPTDAQNAWLDAERLKSGE